MSASSAAPDTGSPEVLGIFGPTAVGKTGVAIESAELLRERGEDPVALSCDAIQVYRGLEILSGAAGRDEQARLEHRLLGIVEVGEEFSAGRFAERAHAEVDALLGEGRRPILVGGAGLYMRAALSELELRPPVPAGIREQVEGEIAERGSEALHAELPAELAATAHPRDRKRIARLSELQRAGIEPSRSSAQLWSEGLRRPTVLVGLTTGRDELRARIGARVDEMLALGAEEEVRSADLAGASRTARAAIGFEELLAGDPGAMRAAQWRYARRQLTWMRKMHDVRVIDREGRGDASVAREIVSLLR
ncbi:MAG: tRNA (adenosine(37)-N6)-dimethylallyltransferase MiaA [Actinomycetota bacterium]|nr:tRNA (adenosine(37)-N6)-dimethylallyltransferase MiaA [Actinomycetota bacterium]